MRSTHHDSKIQGDFLPQYSESWIAWACGTAALSYSSKENGDGWISYASIWGFVSHSVIWLPAEFAAQEDVGTSELDVRW